MKSLLIATTLIFSSSAFALQVGDSSTFSGNSNGTPFTLEMTVTQISGDSYTRHTTVSLGGQSQSSDETGSVSELAQSANVFQNCTLAGGSLETIVTPARAFAVCHVTLEDGEIYITPEVPFGFVKSITTQDGKRTEFNLQSYIMH